jgi:hypothetical protein
MRGQAVLFSGHEDDRAECDVQSAAILSSSTDRGPAARRSAVATGAPRLQKIGSDRASALQEADIVVTPMMNSAATVRPARLCNMSVAVPGFE